VEASTQTGGASATPELGDAELVLSFRSGVEASLAELIRRHQIGVFRLLLGLLQDGDDAERVCEKVFFEVARRIDELAEPAAFYAWVAALAREEAKKIEAERKKAAPPPRPRPPPRDPRGLVKQQVRDILGELSGDERVALILADLEEESYESIATTLGTSAAEAREMVENARTKFRAAAGERHDEPGIGRKAAPVTRGQVLSGRFRIEEALGQGGMGAVYRATDLQSNDVVALKVLLPAAEDEPNLKRRFEREAEMIRRVEHPHFVRYLASGQTPGEPEFVVMELLDGQALSRVLGTEHRLSPHRALRLTRQMLDGLGHAHRVGVVHRDVKPDNVLLVPRPEEPEFVKILDLGIAKLVGPEDGKRTQLTAKGEVFGTPAYMAPEQVRGEEVDGRADLYALSVMLFEMLAARPPFQSNTSMGILAMHLTTEPPKLAEVAPGIRATGLLQPLLDKGLAKEPDERFASAEQFLVELDGVLKKGVDTEVSALAPAAPALGTDPTLGAAAGARAKRRPSAAVPSPAAALRAPAVRLWTTREGRIVAVLVALAVAALALWLAWGYVGPGRSP
jgi:DNA-directed RNA polymerase specialized sigma24 family protein